MILSSHSVRARWFVSFSQKVKTWFQAGEDKRQRPAPFEHCKRAARVIQSDVMIPSMRRLVGAALVLLAVGCITSLALRVWNKHDFCQGWSNHYAARSKEFRAEAAKPGLGHDEARKCLIAADTHDLVSRKYAAVASRPWRPYPSYPLVTAEEQWMIEGRH